MTPAYIRWRCERIEQLLKTMGGPHGLNPPHLQPA